MNYTKKLMEKAEPLIEELKKLRGVKAIAFDGSIGKGIADKYSDIDIFCVCTKFPKIESRKNILEKLNLKEKLTQDYMNSFWLEGTEVHLFFKKMPEIENIFKMFTKQKNHWFEKEVHNYLANIKIVHDPKNILKKMQAKVKNYPSWLRELNTKKITFTGTFDMLKSCIQRNNWLWIDKLLEERVEWALHALYALNKTYFCTYKWFYEENKLFSKKPKKCVERINKIMDMNTRKHLTKKLEMISDLYEDIFKLCKKEYPKLKFVYDYEQRKQKIEEINKLLKRKR